MDMAHLRAVVIVQAQDVLTVAGENRLYEVALGYAVQGPDRVPFGIPQSQTRAVVTFDDDQ
ncbi:hypothetical protein ACWDWU_09665 [Streptomyces sp. NPDC003442]